MITIYNKDINENTFSSFNKLIETKMAPIPAFNLLIISKKIENISKTKNEVKAKIFDKYAELEGDSYIIKKELVDDFKKEMKELENMKHEINVDQFNIEDMKIETSISPKDLYNLYFLFDLDVNLQVSENNN
jgi:hypothetical protein